VIPAAWSSARRGASDSTANRTFTPAPPGGRRELLVDAEGDVDHLPVVELPEGLGPPGRAHGSTARAVGGEAGDRVGDRGRVADRDQRAGDAVVHDLAATAYVGHHEGQAERGSLHRRPRESLPVGREQVDVHRRVQILDVVAHPEERDPTIARRAIEVRSRDRILLRLVGGADDHDLDVRRLGA
jgi:hypothetical protein